MYKSGFIKLNKKNNESKPEVKKKTKAVNERGVVYISHIPHGFYEKEMKHYFSQFGVVTNVSIPKSKKTGNSKGYGFVEFLFSEVAKVVAETMNNYLMHKKILKAKYLAPDEVKKNTFKRKNRNSAPLTVQNRVKHRKLMESKLDTEKEEVAKAKLSEREEFYTNKLKSMGLEYEIQIYNSKLLKCDIEVSDENTSLKTSLKSVTNPEFKGDDNNKIIIPKIKKIKKFKGLKKLSYDN